MTRNQKIALGCGVTGCLGLILIVVVVIVLAAAGILALPGLGAPSSNDNSNVNSSSNANDNSSSSQNPDSNSSTSRSTMSDDDKHKLMQAAGITKDSALMQRVLRKLGFITDTGISDDYPQFIKDHVTWASKNYQFIRSVNNPEAARAYVDAHIND
jgi:cytoskeletal protein RodZ